ncbi:hypothetical protein BXZ70DRAFT_891760 [Cristinia sonorae]|uniref:Uncharacterized protein n=1 Tax=Cristinia sonorae TaxID=1940300 RepID=A0A8K0XQG4_9AGAR|nr:hypothetical protein BXZ70DRAFT_891760 [Cristinia sonorae]
MLGSFAPVNETAAQIRIDEATLVGFDIVFCAYGVHVTMFFLCLSMLWGQRKTRPRQTYVWIAYIVILFILGSLANGINMKVNVLMYVDNRDYPGGPTAYDKDTFSVPINLICTTACILGAWFQDALLLYRFHVIMRATWWMMIVPTILYVASIILSCFLLNSLIEPGSNLWQHSNVNLSLAYWSTTIATNVILTIFIVGKLVRMRMEMRRVMGNNFHVPYLSISAMLVESAGLYTAFGLAFLIPYAQNLTINIVFFSMLRQIQYIAPLLIILRVAQGRALTRETVFSMSTVEWRVPTDSSTTAPGVLDLDASGNPFGKSEKVIGPMTYASNEDESRSQFSSVVLY